MEVCAIWRKQCDRLSFCRTTYQNKMEEIVSIKKKYQQEEINVLILELIEKIILHLIKLGGDPQRVFMLRHFLSNTTGGILGKNNCNNESIPYIHDQLSSLERIYSIIQKYDIEKTNTLAEVLNSYYDKFSKSLSYDEISYIVVNVYMASNLHDQ